MLARKIELLVERVRLFITLVLAKDAGENAVQTWRTCAPSMCVCVFSAIGKLVEARLARASLDFAIVHARRRGILYLMTSSWM